MFIFHAVKLIKPLNSTYLILFLHGFSFLYSEIRRIYFLILRAILVCFITKIIREFEVIYNKNVWTLFIKDLILHLKLIDFYHMKKD